MTCCRPLRIGNSDIIEDEEEEDEKDFIKECVIGKYLVGCFCVENINMDHISVDSEKEEEEEEEESDSLLTYVLNMFLPDRTTVYAVSENQVVHTSPEWNTRKNMNYKGQSKVSIIKQDIT
jgi:hypothetical protein